METKDIMKIIDEGLSPKECAVKIMEAFKTSIKKQEVHVLTEMCEGLIENVHVFLFGEDAERAAKAWFLEHYSMSAYEAWVDPDRDFTFSKNELYWDMTNIEVSEVTGPEGPDCGSRNTWLNHGDVKTGGCRDCGWAL